MSEADNQALLRQNDALRREILELRASRDWELRSEIGGLLVEYLVSTHPTDKEARQRADDVAKLAKALGESGLGKQGDR